MRLLFSSIHCYLDPSSGAALCTRELLELLAARGMDCRVLTTGILDPERETALDEVIATLELPGRRFQAELRTGGAAEVIDLGVNGVRVTLMPTASSRAERSPDPREAATFLELAERVFDRFRPDVLLTYGGHPASLELMRRARLRGIAVVFHLHNFGYNDRRAFADVSAVIFPSEYSRRYHARLLGLDGPVIPDPIPLDRIVAKDPEPKYVTFINPQPSKGMAVFADRRGAQRAPAGHPTPGAPWPARRRGSGNRPGCRAVRKALPPVPGASPKPFRRTGSGPLILPLTPEAVTRRISSRADSDLPVPIGRGCFFKDPTLG